MAIVRAPAFLLLVTAALWAGCGGGGEADAADANGDSGTGQPGELTAFQLEHGIGPVTEVVTLGELDEELAAQGDSVFQVKCAACHKLAERYVGPALGSVIERRSATYIMNMILNPEEMYQRHPVAKDLLAQYLTYMPNQNATREEARAIVEYLRRAAEAAE